MHNDIISYLCIIKNSVKWNEDSTLKNNIEIILNTVQEKEKEDPEFEFDYPEQYFKPIEYGLLSSNNYVHEASLDMLIMLFKNKHITNLTIFSNKQQIFATHYIIDLLVSNQINETGLIVKLLRLFETIGLTAVHGVYINKLIQRIVQIMKKVQNQAILQQSTGVIANIITNIINKINSKAEFKENSAIYNDSIYPSVFNSLNYSILLPNSKTYETIYNSTSFLDNIPYNIYVNNFILLPSLYYQDLFICLTILFISSADTAENVRYEMLTVVQHTLTKSLENVKNYYAFIYLLKHHLIPTLLNNFTSPTSFIISVSLDIFNTLVEFCNDKLIKEVEVFINNVILSIITSENTEFDLKKKVCLYTENSVCQ